MQINEQNLITTALDVIETEALAVSSLSNSIDENFINACKLILNCQGRVIVTGMGKSGHIGKKIAATLASTGTPSYFVHPAEASHGDLGMITSLDVVLALSNSGNTNEITTILPMLKRLNVPLIAFTGDPSSQLAKQSDININVKVKEEACSLGLAPTASTTAALAMGDALSIALLKARGFTPEEFAKSHPGGSLGKKLFLTIDEIMHTGIDIPKVKPSTLIATALLEITNKRLGMTCITDENNLDEIIGIYTDGDLRRTLDNGIDIRTSPISTVMTTKYQTIPQGMLASKALHIMESHKITSLPVVNNENKLIGALNIHDLLKAGVI